MIAGIAATAMKLIPIGPPTSIASCSKIFFFLLHCFLPQNVHPDGLYIHIYMHHFQGKHGFIELVPPPPLLESQVSIGPYPKYLLGQVKTVHILADTILAGLGHKRKGSYNG